MPLNMTTTVHWLSPAIEPLPFVELQRPVVDPWLEEICLDSVRIRNRSALAVETGVMVKCTSTDRSLKNYQIVYRTTLLKPIFAPSALVRHASQ